MDQNIEVESDQLSTNCAQRVLCIYIYIHIHMYLFLLQGMQCSRDQALL